MGDNPPSHHSIVQEATAQDQSVQNNANARDVVGTIVNTFCVCGAYGDEGNVLPSQTA